MLSAIIQGGELKGGSVRISGYRHLALLIIASAIAMNRRVKLRNVPILKDTLIYNTIIERLGGKIEKHDDTWIIESQYLFNTIIPNELSALIRGSIYLVPALLGRLGIVHFGQSGGCQLFTENGKERPVKHMFEILKNFGASFSYKSGLTIGHSSSFKSCVVDIMDYSYSKKRLTGPVVSSATKIAIIAALNVKEGKTIIKNPLMLSYTVVELLKFIQIVGYDVTIGNKYITISSSNEISSNEIIFELIPDISEAITYIACATYNKFPISITPFPIELCEKFILPEIKCIKKMGIDIKWNGDVLFIPVVDTIKSIDIKVFNEGFNTDHQPFFALMLLNASGNSKITEYTWENIFQNAYELSKLGATIDIEKNNIVLYPSILNRSEQVLNATDLRAAATLLIASLKVQGTTTIKNINHLERGYVSLIENLKKMGAKINITN